MKISLILFASFLSRHLLTLLTAAEVLKTSLLQKQIKNHPNVAYKNSVRKCYQVLLFSRNAQFNNPTSIPQT